MYGTSISYFSKQIICQQLINFLTLFSSTCFDLVRSQHKPNNLYFRIQDNNPQILDLMNRNSDKEQAKYFLWLTFSVTMNYKFHNRS